MQVVARGQRASHCALQQAGRLFFTSTVVWKEEDTAAEPRQHRGRDSYSPWAQEVYGSSLARGHGGSAQPQARRQGGDGGQRQRQRQEWDYRPKARAAKDGELPVNHMDTSKALGDTK
jgi:hypothetical protein